MGALSPRQEQIRRYLVDQFAVESDRLAAEWEQNDALDVIVRTLTAPDSRYMVVRNLRPEDFSRGSDV